MPVGLAITAVIVAAVVAGVGLSRLLSRPTRAAPSACYVATSGSRDTYTLTPDQAQNAAIVAAVALKQGLPDHAVTVALATSLRESHLRDLPYGDRDSVGLFQQRPSQGWGTRSQLLDPVYATAAFYHRLTQVPGWQTMPVTEAAQSVQRSATPLAYAAWEAEGRALAAALTGEAPAGFTCHLTGFSGPPPLTDALDAAAASEMGSLMLATPVSEKLGWEVASWAVAHAWRYHIPRVTVAGWRWTASSGRWTHYGSVTAASTTTVQVAYPS
ncbi:MAG TPA: hypothetical protein VFN68_09890 [Acidimicrobiales bacterium]|nr:hypothetical protein [Acidimicrobiales bacterium]